MNFRMYADLFCSHPDDSVASPTCILAGTGNVSYIAIHELGKP